MSNVILSTADLEIAADVILSSSPLNIAANFTIALYVSIIFSIFLTKSREICS